MGIVCVVLGIVSFFVDVPHTQKQTFQADGVRLGVSRTEERKVPAVVSGTLIVGGLAISYPEVWGNGYGAIDEILHKNPAFWFIVGLFCAKLVATVASVSAVAYSWAVSRADQR